MNHFDKVIADLGLTQDSQNEHAWLHSVLSAGSIIIDLKNELAVALEEEPTVVVSGFYGAVMLDLDFLPTHAYRRVSQLLNTQLNREVY